MTIVAINIISNRHINRLSRVFELIMNLVLNNITQHDLKKKTRQESGQTEFDVAPLRGEGHGENVMALWGSITLFQKRYSVMGLHNVF